LVLVLSLVSVPAFAQQVELDLKLWYPGVVGADEWVADYGTYEVEEYPNGLLTLQWEPRHIRTRTSWCYSPVRD